MGHRCPQRRPHAGVRYPPGELPGPGGGGPFGDIGGTCPGTWVCASSGAPRGPGGAGGAGGASADAPLGVECINGRPEVGPLAVTVSWVGAVSVLPSRLKLAVG